MQRIRLKIAVLDDEESVRRALERLLRSAGIGVTLFACGTDFLAQVQVTVPDCLILDLQMPGINGFDVQKQLSAMNVVLPVIVITGQDTPEARARAEAGGANAYLLKPVDEGALLNAIAKASAGSRHA